MTETTTPVWLYATPYARFSFSDLPLMTVLRSPTGIWMGKSTAASSMARKMYQPAQQVTKVEAPAPCVVALAANPAHMSATMMPLKQKVALFTNA